MSPQTILEASKTRKRWQALVLTIPLLVAIAPLAQAAPPVIPDLMEGTGVSPHVEEALGDADRLLAARGVAEHVAAAAAVAGYKVEDPAFDASGDTALEVLLAAVDEAHKLQEEALAGMTPDAWETAASGAKGSAWALEVDRERPEDGLHLDPDAWQDAMAGLDALSVIDTAGMWQATYVLAVGTDIALDRIAQGAPAPKTAEPPIFTPLGTIWIDVNCSGTAADDTVYMDWYLLVIDMCGSDDYIAPAGGAGLPQPLSITIDAAEGDEVFPDLINPAKGGAVSGGISIAVDTVGDDVRGFGGGTRVSGAGETSGIGVLVDLGGDDTYETAAIGIPENGGGTMGGVGLLVDVAGDDVYDGDENEQGSGWFDGVGILVDHSGIDSYFDLSTFSQGSGGVGGIGLLIDGSGDDLYDTPSPFEQGSGVCGGVGVLYDASGDDTFLAPLYSQGFGGDGSPAMIFPLGPCDDPDAPGVGVLLDMGGNDRYVGNGTFVQGAHFGSGIGVLVDFLGADEYTAGNCAQGFGNAAGPSPNNCGGDAPGVGLLLDCGGEDTYTLGGGGFVDGQGTGYGSSGVFLELTGNDTYVYPAAVPAPPSMNDHITSRPSGDAGLFFDQGSACPFTSSAPGNGSGNGTGNGTGVLGGFVVDSVPVSSGGLSSIGILAGAALVALAAVVVARRRA